MTRGLKKSLQVSKELTATAVTRLSGFFFFFSYNLVSSEWKHRQRFINFLDDITVVEHFF